MTGKRVDRLALVTGCFGFLGGMVVEELVKAGWRVVGIGHGRRGLPLARAVEGEVTRASLQELIVHKVPGADDLVSLLSVLRAVPALALFGSLYVLFYALTPKRYRISQCPKWPGAALVAAWWVLTTALLPAIISSLGSYDLTYGSLAGVIIALIFFFVIGLGLVVGAELNAALAETPTPSHEDVVAAVKEEAAQKAEERAVEKAVQEEE